MTKEELKQNLDKINAELAGFSCQLIAVSKTKPIPLLQDAYALGIRVFGENKVQELVEKHEVLPKDISWHMIGHLQTNKVKYIAPFVSLIHSVDSFKLLKEINKRGKQNERKISCLLQIHIAEEETKFGLSKEEVIDILRSEEFAKMENVKVVGVMGMATHTENLEQVRSEFRGLKETFDELQQHYTAPNIDWQEVSMGMSGDYQIAAEEGSTMVRVGSSIFGARNYAK
ncbi:YggS family pyridoxal phosphate-dependent enzyme [Rapidithrix thailandica]|uniref:Pyridoxal phosphate homeostasis protein n=1 Tax=Rapidithrix thailandica TaxID=413964 RepID=A0AAW9SFN1_9BACT